MHREKFVKIEAKDIEMVKNMRDNVAEPPFWVKSSLGLC